MGEDQRAAAGPRLFADDAAVERVGHGLIDRSLPKADWTHEAHLAATLWLVVARPDLDLDRALPGIIRAYNVATGGVNDDHAGYHDTITRCYLAAIRRHAAATTGMGFAARVNALLMSPVGRRDYPLAFWSRERLFSVEARRGFVPPDIRPLP